MAGDQLPNVAFLWLITSLTGSVAALGIVMTALMLPNIAFRLVGGIITDRFHKKLVLIVADLLRGTGTIIALAGIIMILTAFWLLVQAMSLRQSQMKSSSA